MKSSVQVGTALSVKAEWALDYLGMESGGSRLGTAIAGPGLGLGM